MNYKIRYTLEEDLTQREFELNAAGPNTAYDRLVWLKKNKAILLSVTREENITGFYRIIWDNIK